MKPNSLMSYFVVIMVVSTVGFQVIKDRSLLFAILWIVCVPVISVIIYNRINKRSMSQCQKKLKKFSEEELAEKLFKRDFYFPKGCPPVVMLKELKELGCDISRYYDLIFRLLESPDRFVSQFSIDAFYYAFPGDGKMLGEYGYCKSDGVDRKKEIVMKMREEILMKVNKKEKGLSGGKG